MDKLLIEGGARMGIQGKDNLLKYAEATAIMADRRASGRKIVIRAALFVFDPRATRRRGQCFSISCPRISPSG